MAFPTLFPDGSGDPTNPSTHRNVHFHEKIKHLLKFAEKKNGKWHYRFANHLRFPYWALKMIQRKRTPDQCSIYLKQNPGDAHLTFDELRQMAFGDNSANLLSQMSRYVANIPGTASYWHKIREDLKATITHVGPPTFFFTFSAADMHWPELHSLFGAPAGQIDPQERRFNVINNPHIVDWFFTHRLDKFIYKILVV